MINNQRKDSWFKFSLLKKIFLIEDFKKGIYIFVYINYYKYIRYINQNIL